MTLKNKIIIIAASIVLFAGFSAAIQVTPGQETVIDSAPNQSVESSSPLTVTMNGSDLVVSPDISFPSGSVDQTVQLSNESRNYNLTVKEAADWSLETENISRSIELGTSGSFEALSLGMEGNTGIDLDLSTSGEAFQYVSAPSTVSLIPGVTSSASFSYQSQESIDPGTLNGTINVSGWNQTDTARLNLTLSDKTKPVVSNFSAPSYEATQPEELAATVSDNHKVEEVTARVDKEITVNETKTNSSFQDYRLEKINNTENWTVDTEITELGKYYVNLTAEDPSGNTISTIETFQVKELDAVDLDNDATLQLDTFRSGNQVTKDIGELEQDSPITFTLTRFSENLTSDWTISVFSEEEGPQYFNQIGQSATIEEPSNLSLRVESEEATDFNGDFQVSGVQQHENISDLQFSGEFLDCPVPQRKQFQVFSRNISLEPVEADSCTESGWNISYFISSDTVTSNNELSEEISLITPNQVMERERNFREQVLQEREDTIETKNEKIGSLKWRSYLLVFLLAGTGYMAWFTVYRAPYICYLNVKTAENKLIRARRAKKLGVTGRDYVKEKVNI